MAFPKKKKIFDLGFKNFPCGDRTRRRVLLPSFLALINSRLGLRHWLTLAGPAIAMAWRRSSTAKSVRADTSSTALRSLLILNEFLIKTTPSYQTIADEYSWSPRFWRTYIYLSHQGEGRNYSRVCFLLAGTERNSIRFRKRCMPYVSRWSSRSHRSCPTSSIHVPPIPDRIGGEEIRQERSRDQFVQLAFVCFHD